MNESICYARSLPVTWQRRQSHHLICHSWKPHATCKPHGSMFYRRRDMADGSFTLWYVHFLLFLLVRPWPWPNGLHIQTWPIFPRDILHVWKWTSYVKCFESYCILHYSLPDLNLNRGRWKSEPVSASWHCRLCRGLAHWATETDRTWCDIYIKFILRDNDCISLIINFFQKKCATFARSMHFETKSKNHFIQQFRC